MKLFCRYALVVLSMFLFGCQQQQRVLSPAQQQTIQKEVTDQFHGLCSAINQKNAEAWSSYYSKDGFVSAIAGTDYFPTRDAWVNTITSNFAARERQSIEPTQVRVTALAPNLALMTSEEKAEVWLKNGGHGAQRHVFTMIWQKEPTGWKIIHSHESMN